MPFRDHFSAQAQHYARHRPQYPRALFDYLATLAPAQECAWDCGTGNGQAAIELAKHFQRVIATDASREQIENAFPHERVDYRVEQAENTSIPDNSVDLITVGTAVHWFDFDPFYAEVRRVGKPGAILAVWTYDLPIVAPGVDDCIARFYAMLDGYWPERFHYLAEKYRDLPFPFEEIEAPALLMEAEWDLDAMLGFLASWSAVRRYFEREGRHPVEIFLNELRECWGGTSRKVRWPLYFRIGKLAK